MEYRRCEGAEDLEAIYRLRYNAYRLAGMVGEIKDRLISDDLDETPNCYRFGIFIDGELASTIRIHHLSLASPMSGSMLAFGDLLHPRLLRGETFVDPSRLAADPEMAAAHRGLPYVTVRLAVAASLHFNATSCLSTIREEHRAFYQRVINSVQVGKPRSYEGLSVQTILCESNCEANMANILRRFPFFISSTFEQRMLFKRPQRGELVPLTVLPTAKYSLAAA
ncbi:N-acyl amino acid synthase FeeM domain-containing protein [Mesorhizobium sp. BAC0120]|uniref:N-acyl amino acid synthase FeeM domain-containing protein n=1 Tax=Mesorhizobium sp. BAC0120 TaxID=3090670 RepID=UPI00399A6DE7